MRAGSRCARRRATSSSAAPRRRWAVRVHLRLPLKRSGGRAGVGLAASRPRAESGLAACQRPQNRAASARAACARGRHALPAVRTGRQSPNHVIPSGLARRTGPSCGFGHVRASSWCAGRDARLGADQRRGVRAPARPGHIQCDAHRAGSRVLLAGWRAALGRGLARVAVVLHLVQAPCRRHGAGAPRVRHARQVAQCSGAPGRARGARYVAKGGRRGLVRLAARRRHAVQAAASAQGRRHPGAHVPAGLGAAPAIRLHRQIGPL